MSDVGDYITKPGVGALDAPGGGRGRAGESGVSRVTGSFDTRWTVGGEVADCGVRIALNVVGREQW